VFEVGLLSTALSFYAFGLAVFLSYKSPKWRSSPFAIAGLLTTFFICVLAVANLFGVGQGLKVAYAGESYAFTNVLLTILALLAVLFIERSRREKVVQELKYQASHDPLTRLPNRTNFIQTLANEVSAAAPTDGELAVFLLDLDRFKDINDTLGHPVGDYLLQELATRLSEQMPQRATLARFGGDEFALLLTDVHSTAVVENFANFVLEEIRHPFAMDDLTLEVDASIGIAKFPEHGTTHDELLQHADIAMYKAKYHHTGYELYCSADDPHNIRSLTLTRDLRRAIEGQQLEVVFQPKVNVQEGNVTGAEVLARWQRPGQGYVSAEEFITHAEITGLIFPLTKWVLNAALERGSEWRQAGYDIDIAINLYARLLHHATIVPTIASMLRKWDYPANRLTLEITENAILVDPTHAMEMVAQIADLGVKVSIDDFGTGYSSLAYLKNLAVHELKIDKSFVLSMTENASDRTIVKSVISLAHDLGLTVVAEGIETPGSLSILEEFGCDTGQGYLFGRPMPASNFENLVRSEQSGKAGHPKVEAKGADGEDCRVISMVGARDRSRSTDSNDT
jgi:diguanylate cyclase (GGDEF)-like protein